MLLVRSGRNLIGAGCIVLSLVAVACARTLDAVVANPCSAPVEIRFSGGSRPPSADNEWFHRTVVPPKTSTVVDGVLTDVGEEVVGYIQVNANESNPQVIKVPRGTEEGFVTAVIPAVAC